MQTCKCDVSTPLHYTFPALNLVALYNLPYSELSTQTWLAYNFLQLAYPFQMI